MEQKQHIKATVLVAFKDGGPQGLRTFEKGEQIVIGPKAALLLVNAGFVEVVKEETQDATAPQS